MRDSIVLYMVGDKISMITEFEKHFSNVTVIDDAHSVGCNLGNHSTVDDIKNYKDCVVIPFTDNGVKELSEGGYSLLESNLKLIELCEDKYTFAKWLEDNNITTLPTYKDIEEISVDVMPIFLKQRVGCGGVGKVVVKTIAHLNAILTADYIWQPYCNGTEVGVDAYVDTISGEVIDVVIKKKIKMLGGSTNKAEFIHDDRIVNVVVNLIKKLGIVGVVDIDLWLSDNTVYVSEINPRFGGGYILSQAMGTSFVPYIFNNVNGIKNKPSIGNYSDGFAYKYPMIKVVKG